MLLARGGGRDGIVAMAEMNRLARLRLWRAVVAELRWCLARRYGEVERARGSESGRVDGVVGAQRLSAFLGLNDQANAGMLPPHNIHGLWLVGHDAACGREFRRRHHRLIVQLNYAILPNLFVHYKNFLNESCRAT